MRIAVAKYQEEIKAAPIDTPHSNGCHPGLPVLVAESLLGISTKREFFNFCIETFR